MKFSVMAALLLCCSYLSFAQTNQAAAPVQQGDNISQVDGTVPPPQPQDSLPPIDTMPVLKEFVKAHYPSQYAKKGIEGQVQLELIIDTIGKVDSVSIIKGFDHILDSCAAAAAKNFLFSPAKAGGFPVPVIMDYTYRFSIQEVVQKIETYVNLKGKLIERGTRAAIRDAIVVATFQDTLADSTLSVPFGTYLAKIGNFPGQHREDKAIVTTSDSLGQFQFTSLPVGPVVIKCIVPGFEKFEDKEVLKHAELTDVKFYIQRISYGENEIVVYGKAEKKEVTKYTLTLNEIKKIPGLNGDAVKVVQALPGVARASFISGDIVVRGASNSDSRYFIDGIELPVLFHFGGLKSTYNSDALQSVDFYPGGFGTRYGGAVAGVVELMGRPGKTDRLHGTIDANLYDGSIFLEGPISKKQSFLVTGRRSFVGDIVSGVVKYMDLPFTVQPYYWDYIGRTDYEINKDNKIHLTLFGSQDYMKFITSEVRGGSSEISDATNAAFSKSTFHTASIGLTSTISPTIKNDFTYGMEYYKLNMSMFGFFSADETAWMHHIRNQTSIAVAKNATVNLGVDAQGFPVDFLLTMQSASDTVSRDTAKNWWFGDIGLYANLDWKITDKLELIPGIRYDYFPELAYRGSVVPAFWKYSAINNEQGAPGEPSVRLTARYKLFPAHVLKAAVGNYSQSPKPMGQTIMTKWGDPRLPTTKAAHYVVGEEWRINDLISSDVQAYYNHQWDIPRMSTSEDIVVGGAPPKGFIADEKGRMYGLEIMLKHDQGKHFFGWISYSLSRSERMNPHSDGWTLFSKDETHNLQVIGNFRLPKLWEVGFRARYVTGDPLTPVLGIKEYNATWNYYIAEYGKENSSRYDPFFQLDLRIDKKFTFDKWLMSAYLDLRNVSWFVYKSPEFFTYNYNYSEKNIVSDIIYPSIGLSAEF